MTRLRNAMLSAVTRLCALVGPVVVAMAAAALIAPGAANAQPRATTDMPLVGTPAVARVEFALRRGPALNTAGIAVIRAGDGLEALCRYANSGWAVVYRPGSSPVVGFAALGNLGGTVTGAQCATDAVVEVRREFALRTGPALNTPSAGVVGVTTRLQALCRYFNSSNGQVWEVLYRPGTSPLIGFGPNSNLSGSGRFGC